MARFTNVVSKLKPIDRLQLHRRFASNYNKSESVLEEDFRVFDVRSSKAKPIEQQKYVKPPPPPPRELQMPVDQDWASVWPGPRSFHPASVPLPVRQGYVNHERTRIQPGKYANAELMKLPNFLHLTPPAVAKHCAAIKKYCTEWPKNLDTDEKIEKHFPVEVITSTYCHSSPIIRDPKARVVTFKFKLSRLKLDVHAKDKIRRLLGERHNPETDVVTLVTDRCPVRQQNYDYNQYLMLALYYESKKVEEWEKEKVEEDMEYYDWERNASRKAFDALHEWSASKEKVKVDEESPRYKEQRENYKVAVTEWFEKGDDIQRIHNYKESVLKLVF